MKRNADHLKERIECALAQIDARVKEEREWAALERLALEVHALSDQAARDSLEPSYAYLLLQTIHDSRGETPIVALERLHARLAQLLVAIEPEGLPVIQALVERPQSLAERELLHALRPVNSLVENKVTTQALHRMACEVDVLHAHGLCSNAYLQLWRQEESVSGDPSIEEKMDALRASWPEAVKRDIKTCRARTASDQSTPSLAQRSRLVRLYQACLVSTLPRDRGLASMRREAGTAPDESVRD